MCSHICHNHQYQYNIEVYCETLRLHNQWQIEDRSQHRKNSHRLGWKGQADSGNHMTFLKVEVFGCHKLPFRAPDIRHIRSYTAAFFGFLLLPEIFPARWLTCTAATGGPLSQSPVQSRSLFFSTFHAWVKIFVNDKKNKNLLLNFCLEFLS